MLLDIIITSLINGSTYALLAIGFSLIFGVARIVNIAHTAFYMVAAYCIYFVTYNIGYHPIVGMLIGVPLVTLLGMVTYQRTRGRSINWYHRSGHCLTRGHAAYF